MESTAIHERMTIWLSRRGARIAHLRPDCQVLARRPMFLPPPIEIAAEPLRKGLVRYRQVRGDKGRVVNTEARLCWRCTRRAGLRESTELAERAVIP